MTWLEKAGAARRQLPGRPASLRGAGLPASLGRCVQPVTQGKNLPGPRSTHLSKQNSVSGSRRWHVVREKMFQHFLKGVYNPFRPRSHAEMWSSALRAGPMDLESEAWVERWRGLPAAVDKPTASGARPSVKSTLPGDHDSSARRCCL